MRLRRVAIASMFALGAGAVVGCGDDDDSAGTTADDETPDDRADDEATAPATGETGGGSVVIGDETFAFDVVACEEGTEETGDDGVLFRLLGEGDDDLAVEVLRRSQPGADPDADPETFDSVFLFEDVPVGQTYVWEALSAPAGMDAPTAGGFLEIDGDRVTGTAEFLDRLDEEVPPTVAEGTFEASCP